ncbi:MAG: hypothetical protein ABJD68_19230, partial [Nakamurella sp.]
QELPPAPESNGFEQSDPPSEPAGAGKDGDANGGSSTADHSGSSGEPTAQPTAANPPRRRRAASRPAGPAAGNANAQTVVVTVPPD